MSNEAAKLEAERKILEALEKLTELLPQKVRAYGDAHSLQLALWDVMLKQYLDPESGTQYIIPRALIAHLARITRLMDRVLRIVANPEVDPMGEDPWTDAAGDCVAGMAMPKIGPELTFHSGGVFRAPGVPASTNPGRRVQDGAKAFEAAWRGFKAPHPPPTDGAKPDAHYLCPSCGTRDSAEAGYWKGMEVPCSGGCGAFMDEVPEPPKGKPLSQVFAEEGLMDDDTAQGRASHDPAPPTGVLCGEYFHSLVGARVCTRAEGHTGDCADGMGMSGLSRKALDILAAEQAREKAAKVAK